MTLQKWIDLSAYGVSLILVTLPSGNQLMVIDGHQNSPHKELIQKSFLSLGYNLSKAGFLYSDNMKISPSAVFRLLPKGKVAEMPVSQIRQSWRPPGSQADQPKAQPGRVSATGPRKSAARVRAPEPARLDVALTQHRRLGLNSLGQEVFEGIDGRFIRDQGGKLHREAEVGNITPALFLRAEAQPPHKGLDVCADGLVNEIAGGRIIRFDDLKRFAAAVMGQADEDIEDRDPRVRLAVDAVADAMQRRVARRMGSSREVYALATQLQEAGAFLSDATRVFGPLGHPSLPILSILQRAIGGESEVGNKKIAIIGAHGRAADILASNLPATSEIGRDERHALYQIGLLPPDTNYHVEIDEIVGARGPAGRTLLVFAGDPEADEAIKALRTRLGESYEIEGTARIDPSLHAGDPGAQPLTLIALGRLRPERLQPAPEASLRVQPISSHAELWTWSSELISTRAKIAEWRRMQDDEVDEAQQLLAGNVDRTLENKFQTPYQPLSRASLSRTMIPRSLEGATREALERLARRHGDIDRMVCEELGWTNEELQERLSAEQVDGFALSIDAEMRGRGMLIADQTGVGKGRQIAAMILRHVLAGRKVIFLTERELNLHDIWRDICHIRADGFISPLILNDGVRIVDDLTTETLLSPVPTEEMREILRSGKWPEGFNVVLGTYSQFNRPALGRGGKLVSLKSKWLRETVTAGSGIVAVADEVHNLAAKESNQLSNIDAVLNNFEHVHYSSATHAKTGTTLRIYRRLMPPSVSMNNIIDTMSKGGELLQEVFTSMLAKDGVMIRRELDLSEVEFEVYHDSDHYDRNRAIVNQIAPILAAMANISGEVDGFVARMDKDIEEALANVGDDEREQMKGKLGVSKLSFGSPLHHMTRLLIAALKADAVVAKALIALDKSMKPMIVIENTIETLLKDIVATRGDDGQRVDVADDALEGVEMPDFRSLFHRMLNQVCKIREKVDGVWHTRDLAQEMPDMAEAIRVVARMIDEMPIIPASPIDVVREKIEAQGHKIAEISGRGLRFVNGRIVRISKEERDKTRIKNAFNSGDLDAIVVTVAGCTGISLHAGARFADQRRRNLIELQAPSDVLKQIQAYGRVNRFDQVNAPLITTVNSGLPIELRLIAIRNAHLRRMSANVSANRDHAALVEGIPDMFNRLGDRICSTYIEERPDLAKRLGIKLYEPEDDEDVDDGGDLEDSGAESSDEIRSANQIMCRLIMLPIQEQERVARELTAEFEAAVQELDVKGLNPLKVKELDGTVEVRSRKIFEGDDSSLPRSCFDEPVFVESVLIERSREPMRSGAVMIEVEKGQQVLGRALPEAAADRIEANRTLLLAHRLPARYPTVEAALAGGDTGIVEAHGRLTDLCAALRGIYPGAAIRYSQDVGTPATGLITRVISAPAAFEHIPSHWEVEIVAPGSGMPVRLKLKTLMMDEHFALGPGIKGESYQEILDTFDHAGRERQKISGHILTGNLFRATQLAADHKLGSVVVFKDANGVRNRGVLVSKQVRNFDALPVRMPSPECFVAFAAAKMAKSRGVEGATLYSNPDLESKKGLMMMRVRNQLRISMPNPGGRNGAGFFENQPLLQEMLATAAENGWIVGARPYIQFEDDQLVDWVRRLADVGISFYALGTHRNWVNDWIAQQNPQAPAPAAPVEIPAAVPAVEVLEEAPVEQDDLLLRA